MIPECIFTCIESDILIKNNTINQVKKAISFRKDKNIHNHIVTLPAVVAQEKLQTQSGAATRKQNSKPTFTSVAPEKSISYFLVMLG